MSFFTEDSCFISKKTFRMLAGVVSRNVLVCHNRELELKQTVN